MELNYIKNDNEKLFANFRDKNLLEIEDAQNYIPIYQTFFNLNEKNYNNINLNNFYKLQTLEKKISYNKFSGKVLNSATDELKNREVFFKFCPLLDPIRYITNKYDLSKNLLTLPKFNDDNNYHAKVLDTTNMAYVDSFFTFLTSKLLHEKEFIHGLDFYGSFLAIKNNFLVNIYDDLDLLFNNDAFHLNNNALFKIENVHHLDMLNFDTRNNKKKIVIDENESALDVSVLDLEELSKLTIDISNGVRETRESRETRVINSDIDLIFNSVVVADESKSKNTNSSGSTCSSRSSNTIEGDSNQEVDGDKDGDLDGDDEDSDLDGDSDRDTKSGLDSSSKSGSYSTASEDEIFISINKFPIQIIALESCDATLDSYISNTDIGDKEWDSIVLQILMMLITYQKVFNMTHNDLHTNNIMYNTTERKNLYYKIENKYYKVPTYGKIYKIIDYGRAIYTFKSNVFCSDSYHKDGDAATQYNFGKYMDDKKPRLEPNYSFDLCRLSCSLIDFFIDDMGEIEKLKSPIKKIIINWCLDDKGRNILYKNNGDERYPDFKLYKMIARTVHNHVPLSVLKNLHFSRYIIEKKKINNAPVMNIDSYAVYT